jgi:hypothetical protein
MNRATPIAAVATLLLLALAPSAHAGVRDDRPNIVGGELGGRGLVLTANYERYITNQFGIGGGIMAINGSDGLLTIAPVYVSVLIGNINSLYVAAGGTHVTGTGSSFNSSWLIHGSIGYQHQSTGGIFVRPFFSIISSTGKDREDIPRFFILLPGLTIGGSF